MSEEESIKAMGAQPSDHVPQRLEATRAMPMCFEYGHIAALEVQPR